MPKQNTIEQYVNLLNRNSTLSLIVSVTRDCVLRCKYCYARDPNYCPSKKVLSPELLEKLINDAFDVRHKHIIFEWTGGEALLAGKKFYENVIRLQKKYVRNGKTYSNGMQCSGAYYDESLYDFLIENKFHPSLTIDGPKDLHDFQRPAIKGHKSFDNVFRSFEYIKKRQKSCGVLCTITKKSLHRWRDIVDFFKKAGINSWYTNAYIHDPAKPVHSKSLGLTADECAEYFKNEFDYLLELDDEKINSGYPCSIMRFLSGVEGRTKCSQGGMCLTNFINIDNEGNATLCPKFIGYDEFGFGNIRNSTISELISISNPPVRKLVTERSRAINKCKKSKCEYFHLCNGGCPYYSYLSAGDGSVEHRDMLCGAKRKLYRHIDRKLQSYGAVTMTSVHKKTVGPESSGRLNKNMEV